MRRSPLVPVFIAGLLLTACGPAVSLHPLYTDGDVLFEPGLLGTWETREGDESLTFAANGQRSYECLFTEKEKPSKLTLHVLRLGSHIFFDAQPSEGDGPGLTISPHFFCRIEIGTDSLRIAYLDEDWLGRMIRAGRVKIAHEMLDDRIVLTASTRDLQRLVSKHAEDAEAFPDAQTLYRRR